MFREYKATSIFELVFSISEMPGLRSEPIFLLFKCVLFLILLPKKTKNKTTLTQKST